MKMRKRDEGGLVMFGNWTGGRYEVQLLRCDT